MSNLVDLIRRFCDLRTSQRRDIGLSLELIDEDDIRNSVLSEQDRNVLILTRARERGAIDRLAEKVSKLEMAQSPLRAP